MALGPLTLANPCVRASPLVTAIVAIAAALPTRKAVGGAAFSCLSLVKFAGGGNLDLLVLPSLYRKYASVAVFGLAY